MRTPKPCRKCGGPKPPGAGRIYCEECEAALRWQSERRDAARRAARRKPCRGCGALRKAGRGHTYCERCRAERAGPRRCPRCRELNIPRSSKYKYAKLCDDCKRAACERRRERERERGRRRRADADARAAMLAANARYQARLKSDPERWAAYLEAKRMQYRIAKEQRGEALPTRQVRHSLPGIPGSLLAKPLADAIQLLIKRREVGNPYDIAVDPHDNNYRRTEQVCAEFGISARTLFRWRSAVSSRVQFEVADRIITRADLAWWDVWNADTVDAEELDRAQSLFEGVAA